MCLKDLVLGTSVLKISIACPTCLLPWKAQTLRGIYSHVPYLRGIGQNLPLKMTDAPLTPNLGQFMPSCPHHRWPFRQLPQFLVQGSVCLLEFTVQGWRKGPHQPKDHVALQKVPVERKEIHTPHGSGDPSCKVTPCISHLDSWEKPLPSVFIEKNCLTAKSEGEIFLVWSGVGLKNDEMKN